LGEIKKRGEMNFEEAVKELQLTDPITRKPITAKELIDILKEDVVYAVERPGSWEGANMLEVLTCHGFLLERYITNHD
jgi:hypothetical protein